MSTKPNQTQKQALSEINSLVGAISLLNLKKILNMKNRLICICFETILTKDN